MSSSNPRNTKPLYPHSVQTILPLIRAHLPYSISVYGTLLASIPLSDRVQDDFVRGDGAGREGSLGSGWDWRDQVVYATFSEEELALYGNDSVTDTDTDTDTDININSGTFTIIARYPSPDDHQIRIYCSAERGIRCIDDTASQSSSTRPCTDQLRLDWARDQVLGALSSYIAEIDPSLVCIGKVHDLWLTAVERRYLVIKRGAKRPRHWIWVPRVIGWGGDQPRENDHGDLGYKRNEPAAHTISLPAGYEADKARLDDLRDFHIYTDAAREEAYYASRLEYGTVIRTLTSLPQTESHSHSSFDDLWTSPSTEDNDKESLSLNTVKPNLNETSTTSTIRTHSTDQSTNPARPSTVARVLTHTDGSLGALHTHSSHRRKGLARQVVLAHLLSGRGHIHDPLDSDTNTYVPFTSTLETKGWTYAVVYEGNVPSEQLWLGLGWVRGWRSGSVYRVMTSGYEADKGDMGVGVGGGEDEVVTEYDLREAVQTLPSFHHADHRR